MAGKHLVSRAFWARFAFSLAFRIAAYDAMLFMALWAEARPAPSLPDPLIAWVPYVEVVARYNYLLWIAAYVPAATPRPVIAKIAQTMRDTLREPEIASKLDGLGYDIIGSTPDELRSFYQQEYGRFAELVKNAGIVPE